MRFHRPPVLRPVHLSPASCLMLHAVPREEVVCEEGELHLTQTLMWIGTTPLQTHHVLHPGERCTIESDGWLELRAGAQAADLHLEAPVNRVLALLQRVGHYLRRNFLVQLGTPELG